ncbi:hypothetical protein [Flavobacterium sp. JP2137]|uniref:hypothetical protein n=1 Tax=Flavobacterium sp. JP2137 TaxID=3414510 RepID=UPI003D3009A1
MFIRKNNISIKLLTKYSLNDLYLGLSSFSHYSSHTNTVVAAADTAPYKHFHENHSLLKVRSLSLSIKNRVTHLLYQYHQTSLTTNTVAFFSFAQPLRLSALYRDLTKTAAQLNRGIPLILNDISHFLDNLFTNLTPTHLATKLAI